MSNDSSGPNLSFIFGLWCICSGIWLFIEESYVAGCFAMLLGLAGIFGKEGR